MKRDDITKEILEKLYLQEQKSISQIFKELGCSNKTIIKKLKKFNIPTRRGKEGTEWQWKHLSSKRIEWLKKGEEKFKTNPTIKTSKRGYEMIYIPRRGWKKMHHYIWEQTNGAVPVGFVLHHINFNRLDNRIENLVLMNKKEHAQLHYAKRIINKYGQFGET